MPQLQYQTPGQSNLNDMLMAQYFNQALAAQQQKAPATPQAAQNPLGGMIQGAAGGGGFSFGRLPWESPGLSTSYDPGMSFPGVAAKGIPDVSSLPGLNVPNQPFSMQTAYSPEALSTVGAPGTVDPFAMSGLGGAGNAILPLAGAAGAFDLFKNKRTGARGALQGGASGAAMGSYFGPWGAAIGGGVGLGAGLANTMLNKPSTKDIQAGRWGAAGHPEMAQPGGYDYGSMNPDFMRTRDEKYLTANDIRVNPDNYNNVADWGSWSTGNQDAFLNEMLKQGKVQEKKGGIYYDDAFAQNLANQIRSGQMPAANAPAAKAGIESAVGNAFGIPRGNPGANPAIVPLMAGINSAVQSPAQMTIPKRSQTRSPGIGLNGQPINYR